MILLIYDSHIYVKRGSLVQIAIALQSRLYLIDYSRLKNY